VAIIIHAEYVPVRDSVVVENPDYTIYSDTLKYNTVSNTAYFIGPTRIISDSTPFIAERLVQYGDKCLYVENECQY
jgi:hypothetical protein